MRKRWAECRIRLMIRSTIYSCRLQISLSAWAAVCVVYFVKVHAVDIRCSYRMFCAAGALGRKNTKRKWDEVQTQEHGWTPSNCYFFGCIWKSMGDNRWVVFETTLPRNKGRRSEFCQRSGCIESLMKVYVPVDEPLLVPAKSCSQSLP